MFPEFYFLDCHSCHRPITDDPNPAVRFQSNPGRPIPWGMPPFNDENMIMLSAAARVTAPAGRGTAKQRWRTASTAQTVVQHKDDIAKLIHATYRLRTNAIYGLYDEALFAQLPAQLSAAEQEIGAILTRLVVTGAEQDNRQVAAALPVTKAAPTRPLRASAAQPALAAEGVWQEF